MSDVCERSRWPMPARLVGGFLLGLTALGLTVVGLIVLTGPAAAQLIHAEAPAVPTLVFEAPDGFAGKIEQLQRFDTASLADAMFLLGLDDPGPPIQVIVAPEGSDAAQLAPSWAMAYAIGGAGVIVMIPNRVPSYPDNDLFQVLRHEIVHILIDRAAGHRPVPRWWHEGLAMVSAREWHLEDRGRLMWAAFRREALSMREVDAGFSGGQFGAARSYVMSAAFMRYLIDREGPSVVRRVFTRLRAGHSFDRAIYDTTGVPLRDIEVDFWRHLDLWNRWVPFLSSSAALWGLISALAVVAFVRRRMRVEEIRERWDEEDAIELRQAPSGEWIH